MDLLTETQESFHTEIEKSAELLESCFSCETVAPALQRLVDVHNKNRELIDKLESAALSVIEGEFFFQKLDSLLALNKELANEVEAEKKRLQTELEQLYKKA